MDRGVFHRDDVAETALSIWARAHGLIKIYLSGPGDIERWWQRDLDLGVLDESAGHTELTDGRSGPLIERSLDTPRGILIRQIAKPQGEHGAEENNAQ
jgi:hypothetical protein